MQLTKEEIKIKNLHTLADHRDKLRKSPELRQLFLELTLACNEACFHCGSRCTPGKPDGLPVETLEVFMKDIKDEFGTAPYIAITGGEPLLYPDFFRLTAYIRDLGFHWGMTSNATLITPEVAEKLADNGMRTISVSIDGLPETHDRYRGLPGGYEKAMAGIQNLIDVDAFSSIMVTTVVNHENISELDALFDIFSEVDINEWRLTGLEPIGRALEHPEMLLTTEDNRRLLDFIKAKREQKIPVTYSCCHFLGLDYEAEVRDWYFLCNAGIYVAGITETGDITACLDIPRNKKTVQGNITRDSFTDVWNHGFEIFRTPLSARNTRCATCPQVRFCEGGSYHSWDYEADEPKVCFLGELF